MQKVTIPALAALAVLVFTRAEAQTDRAKGLWKPPVSRNSAPHFEVMDGRKVLFVDGLPFTALSAETEWNELIHGKYAETMGVYDYTYPAAAKMQLNALKVPVKWSMVEPEEGRYDFAYVDHAKHMAEENHLKLILNWFGHYASGQGTAYRNFTGEVFAPMYIIKDEQRFPRAVDADGKPHPDALSFDYPAIIERETAALRAFLEHIRKVDSATHTVIMIQVENEIAVFGSDRRNPKMWRDHSPAAEKRFREKHFTDDLRYTAWDYAVNWLRPITEAGVKAYPLPFFVNFVGGKLADWMTGGAPGEDVATYLDNCPAIVFAGLNLYVSNPADYSADDFRMALDAYRIGRNLPSLTETNSGNSPLSPRHVFLAVGEYGSPLFAPWSLIVSYPERNQPYVARDGTIGNGAAALTEAYSCLRKALPPISYFGGTDQLKVFLADLPGARFSQTKVMRGVQVSVSGSDNGQAIVIRPSDNEVILVGYRCSATLKTGLLKWPAMEHMQVERGAWAGGEWQAQSSEPVDQSRPQLKITLTDPDVVRIWW